MVCTFGRMACIARLLDSGDFPEDCSEETKNERRAIQSIYRQFRDADAPNLLEEKDMDVFDSRPLTDPLHLVCCNSCKKPVKASHFAAHTERCRSVNSEGDTAMELDGDRKKLPKKGRRKNDATNGREKQKSELLGRDNAAASELKLDNQNSMLYSLLGEAQREAVSVQHVTITETSTVRRGATSDSDMPRPLATKIYYSQGNHRLRTALGHLYHQSTVKEHGNGSICTELKQDKSLLSSLVPNADKPLHEIHKDALQTKF